MSKTTWSERWGAVVFFVVAGALLSQVSCASLKTLVPKGEQGTAQAPSPKGLVFHSDDYIMYRVNGEETSVTLAEFFLGDKKKAWMIEDENGDTTFKKGQVVVIPLKSTNRGGLTRKGYQVVPIFCYHTFSESCETPLCTPRETFDQQMNYLNENHYRVISLEQLRGFLQYRNGLPERSMVITFDDGYRAVYDIAFPILKKYGFKGTLFIYTDIIGKSKNAITWDELRHLKAEGFEIGSHSLSHSDLTKMKKGETREGYLKRIKKELRLSKQILDKELKQDTIYMAYPFGNYNQGILYLSEQAGYKMGFSVKRGGNPFFADPLALRRDQIKNMDVTSFAARLDTFKELSLE